MDALDLLVQIDPWMSATARVADFVIAPRIWLEVPGTSQVLDWLTRNGTGYGQSDPYAQYSPALLDPPPGSDGVEEWDFFYELERAMGLSLPVAPGLAGMTARPAGLGDWKGVRWGKSGARREPSSGSRLLQKQNTR